MKLEKKYQIERAVSKDKARITLLNIHITEDRKRLVATNGQIMVVVPVELNKADDRGNGVIEPSVLVDARKKSKCNDLLEIDLNETFKHIDNVNVPRSHEPEYFPNFEQVIPKHPIIKSRITFNPKHLMSIVRAIGATDNITMEIQDKCLSTIILRNGDAFGLLTSLRNNNRS